MYANASHRNDKCNIDANDMARDHARAHILWKTITGTLQLHCTMNFEKPFFLVAGLLPYPLPLPLPKLTGHIFYGSASCGTNTVPVMCTYRCASLQFLFSCAVLVCRVIDTENCFRNAPAKCIFGKERVLASIIFVNHFRVHRLQVSASVLKVNAVATKFVSIPLAKTHRRTEAIPV